MAVYTKLNEQDIKDFLANYNIGDLISFQEIIDGIDNSNFIIKTQSGKFILTIFESRIAKNDLPFFINLKLHLSNNGVCCPKPIANKSGSLINNIKNKSALIVTFLSGTMLRPQENGIYNNIEEKHCSEIGKNLAIMHNAVSDFQETRHNDLGVFDFTKLFNKMLTEIDSYQDGLKDEIANYINFVQENWQAELPQGVVHVDLFPDNVFFNKNNEVSGIIDFYFAANDLFIYDLAITINAWAFDKNNNLDHTKYDSIIKSYQTIRKLNDAEKKFLKIALIAASLRFLLTRLYDKFNTPKDSLVKIKDPQEYLEKVRLFFQNQ